MKKYLLLFFLAGCQVYGQAVYQPADVEQPAEPAGGNEVLNLFLTSNLRVPVKSAWRGLNKRVFVKAVVETDGTASDIQVIRGIDPLCDAEAVRVMNLYKAWKPAMLKGVPVRQSTVLSMLFKSAPIPHYDSAASALVTYFDESWVLVQDQKAYYYRRSIPVDETGFMNGDIRYDKKEFGKWEKLISVPLMKEPFWVKTNVGGKKDSVRAVRTSATIEGWHTPIYQLVERQENGGVLTYNEFNENGQENVSRSFDLNGVLKEQRIDTDEIHQEISWYANGQLACIVQRPAGSMGPYTYKIREFYDEKGTHLIINGNGFFGPGPFQRHGFEGHGAVKDGLKEGLWIAKSKDSTLLFEEHYEKGKLIKGTSYADGGKLEYTQVEVQPEFRGGMTAMYNYLGRSIMYPDDAARRNIQGKVFASFVVCEDGTLCDFEIVKGLHRSIDTEALRVIKGMSGKWEPGWQRGKKVRVKYNLPINFQLN